MNAKKHPDNNPQNNSFIENLEDKPTVSLCEIEDTRSLLNESIQGMVNHSSDYLSNYYHRYPNLTLYVSIIHDDVVTIDSNAKYANCQASLLVTTDYAKDNPLKLEFIKYTVRISDNGQSINTHIDSTRQERERIYDKIRKWILFIDK
jgi:hypothetical protein